MVGVEGHNPSGHCLIASKIVDSVPFSITSSEERPSKRQALDDNLQASNPLQESSKASLVSTRDALQNQ